MKMQLAKALSILALALPLVWGQTNVGLLADYQKQTVSGFGAGEIIFNGAPALQTGGTAVSVFPTTVADVNSAFRNQRTHTHLSGLFESSLFAEAPIFEVIPFLNKIDFLRSAVFRTGYTYTLIGQVARPGNSIVWNGYPKIPQVQTVYKNWIMGQWTFALEWRF